ncbi:hypothetical protein JW859_10180 [bacterium]|nr:hypothetical protein [bacterium]
MHRHFLVGTSVLLVLLLTLLSTSAVAKAQVPNSGQLVFFDQTWSIDYTITGVEMSSLDTPEFNDHLFSGEAKAPVVNIQGQLNLSIFGKGLGEFNASLKSGSAKVKAFGNPFNDASYDWNGPAWNWQGSLDGRDSDTSLAKTVPFNLNIPVPAFDEAQGVENIYVKFEVTSKTYNYRWGEPDDFVSGRCTLKGTIAIPEDLKVPPTLTVTNGGELDPLKIRLELRDNSFKPAQPMKDAALKITAPLPNKPASALGDYFNTADWKLAGYFHSATKCPNCKWTQASSQFTSDIFYYLEKPGEPIEVLTDDQGVAELEFYLDFPALGANVPRRDKPLKVPIKVAYDGVEGGDKGKLLAEAELEVSLNYLGYVVTVTYIQPQEWEARGGLGDYRPADQNVAEYPLDTYFKDTGTGLPYAEVSGADRVTIVTGNQLVAPVGYDGYGVGGDSAILQPEMPAQQLKPGMLLGLGDQINLDARGLIRLKPLAKTDPSYGMTARPGWVWVTVRFFDGLKAKVGCNGITEQHTVTIGRTPEDSGWVPTSKSFCYWAAKEAGEHLVSKLIPVYGQIDLVTDVAGYIRWINNGEPVYIRVESAFQVSPQDDGTVQVVVREGHPTVLTSATGFGGLKATTGQSVTVGAGNGLKMTTAQADQNSSADQQLAKLLDVVEGSSGLAPVELATADGGSGGVPGTPGTPGSQEAGVGEMPDDYYAGDAPLEGLATDDMPDDYSAGDVAADFINYRFDDFSLDLSDGYDFTPESEDSFASFANEGLGLYIVVIRAETEPGELLDLLEMEYAAAIRRTVAGQGAQWIPLLDGGKEYGALLSFNQPLANGNRLFVHFIAEPADWRNLADEVQGILERMGF